MKQAIRFALSLTGFLALCLAAGTVSHTISETIVKKEFDALPYEAFVYPVVLILGLLFAALFFGKREPSKKAVALSFVVFLLMAALPYLIAVSGVGRFAARGAQEIRFLMAAFAGILLWKLVRKKG